MLDVLGTSGCDGVDIPGAGDAEGGGADCGLLTGLTQIWFCVTGCFLTQSACCNFQTVVRSTGCAVHWLEGGCHWEASWEGGRRVVNWWCWGGWCWVGWY